MGEILTAEKGTPQATGQSSDGKKESTSQQTTKTYTEVEYQKAVSDERANAGRVTKALEKQLSEVKKMTETLTTQLAEKDTEIKDVQEHKERIEAELDEMSKDDPDRTRYIKKLKSLEGYETELKKTKSDLEGERKTWADDVKVAKEVKRNVLMGEIAGEYDSGDTEILKDLCDKLEIPDNSDKIRIIAGSIWKKTAVPESEEEKKIPPETISGATKGGSGINLDLMTGREKIDKGLEIAKSKKK